MAKFYGWGPTEMWEITGAELVEACRQAGRIAASQANAKER